MFELSEMSIRKKTIQVEPIAKKKESRLITTPETTDSLQVGLESK